jgi:hypothetical protein
MLTRRGFFLHDLVRFSSAQAALRDTIGKELKDIEVGKRKCFRFLTNCFFRPLGRLNGNGLLSGVKAFTSRWKSNRSRCLTFAPTTISVSLTAHFAVEE